MDHGREIPVRQDDAIAGQRERVGLGQPDGSVETDGEVPDEEESPLPVTVEFNPR